MTREIETGQTLANTEKPTLRTIAQATGFSVATVSRALADDQRIAARTRATVAEAAKRLGYMPDRAARRLRTGRTQVITLLLNTEHEFLGFTHEFLSGITEALRGTGYSVTVVPTIPARTGWRRCARSCATTSPTVSCSPAPNASIRASAC
jgi:LacI family transcriptional regulator